MTEKITEELQATAEEKRALNPSIFMNDAGVKQDVFGEYNGSRGEVRFQPDASEGGVLN